MGMSKHILILGHVPLPEDHPDFGRLVRHPGRWVFDQAKALTHYSNYKITLVTLVKGASRDFEKQFGGLRVIYLKAQSKLRERTGFFFDIKRIKKVIRQEKPHLVHAHGTEDAYGLAATIVDLPRVLTIQGLYHDVNSQTLPSFLSPPYVLQKLEAICLDRFDCAIVKSNHVADLAKSYFPHLELSVIPNTLSEEFLNVSWHPKKKKKIAFIGSILPRKGFHHIREALEILRGKVSVEFHVFGTSSDYGYIKREKNLIKNAGHEVVMHGDVDASKIVEELVDCNLLIAPSYAETFGNQVIEAMLCNCHCIVSDDTGMAENIRKYGHGTIVPQRGAQEIADAIIHQIEQGGTDLEMQSRNRTRAKVIAELGPQKIAQKLSEIYSQKLP